MEGYIGEREVENTYSKEEMALRYIEMYSGIDGAHHKDWILDQVARILLDVPVKVTIAEWVDENKQVIKSEKRYRVLTSEKYEDWVRRMCDGEDGPDTYFYDEGIPP